MKLHEVDMSQILRRTKPRKTEQEVKESAFKEVERMLASS
jgi:hypothetical protein